MKIYTRRGDDGTTGLLFGGRVSKDSPLPTAYGSVDEAQAAIGVARAHSSDDALDAMLVSICRDLYVAMAELATAEEYQHRLVDNETLITSDMIDRLETLIDRTTAEFDMPTEFVIPGGSHLSAALDLARTVVRRAEREALNAVGATSHVVAYLNRLSDLLWALARQQEGSSTPSRE